jgi:4-diphosphocytidyl-2-C-methyl-D-erythritol kinase
MNTLVIPSPAKINLFLKVTGKRADGYHELVSLMCRVDLYDTVTLSFDQPSISVHCPHPKVPEGKTNLAYKAAALFFNALSRRDGVAIFIEKLIPVAAGLGGGSSNAAAVLMGLNQHHGFPFSNKDLMELGLKVGADVPFFLFKHTAVARGIGEHLERFDRMPPLSAVLVCPRVQISTAWVYEHLNLRLTNCEENCSVSWFLEDLSKLKDLLCNDLEQVAVKKFPEINTIKTALLDLGAHGAIMSGSGPTVFGLFQGLQQASLALKRIEQQGHGDCFLVNLLIP